MYIKLIAGIFENSRKIFFFENIPKKGRHQSKHLFEEEKKKEKQAGGRRGGLRMQ